GEVDVPAAFDAEAVGVAGEHVGGDVGFAGGPPVAGLVLVISDDVPGEIKGAFTAQERFVGGHHGVNLAHEVQVGFAFPLGDGEPDQQDAEGDHRAEGFSEGVNFAGHGGFIWMVCGGGCWRPTSLWAGRNARPPWSYSLSGAWVETSRCSPRGPAAESRALFVGF